MKTNLDKFYKTDKKIETQGIWFKISDEVGFLVKRFGGYNSPDVKAALAKHYKPYSKQIDAGTIAPDKEREVLAKAFVDSVVIDWKGVEIDGKITPFSKEIAVPFFLGLPDLMDALTKHASDADNYREDLGN
jgi:hypothetical protein